MKSRNLDREQIMEAFDQWERTQVCIRSHVRIVREDVEALFDDLARATNLQLEARAQAIELLEKLERYSADSA